MKLENSINYYYALKALQFLLEQGLLSESEYEKICRYNAEIFCPEREYI
ncbi:MAG: SHOCT domain-containing protein [Acutalibacter sp.]